MQFWLCAITLLIGIGIGCFLMSLRNPDKQAQTKLEYDLKHRLGPDGKPLNPQNDYERHLYARSLKLKGKSRAQVARALFDLGMDDIPALKRNRYIADILESALVGFGGNLPAFEEVKTK